VREYLDYCEKGIDVIEDMIDAFWENPTAFGLCRAQAAPRRLIDIFAGRVYDEMRSHPRGRAPFAAFWAVSERTEWTLPISMPIGSRYHPERAGIWNTDDSVEMTEAGCADDGVHEVAPRA
jgi:hypothetical protein